MHRFHSTPCTAATLVTAPAGVIEWVQVCNSQAPVFIYNLHVLYRAPGYAHVKSQSAERIEHYETLSRLGQGETWLVSFYAVH